MKRTQAIVIVLVLVFGSILSSCNLSGDLEEMKVLDIPELKSGDGREGGGGGENPPPPGE